MVGHVRTSHIGPVHIAHMGDAEGDDGPTDDTAASEAWQKHVCHAAVEGKCYYLAKKPAFAWAIAKERMPDESASSLASVNVARMRA